MLYTAAVIDYSLTHLRELRCYFVVFLPFKRTPSGLIIGTLC